jgi:hypothetical protein
MKVDDLHPEVKMFRQQNWFVTFKKNLITSMLVEKLTCVGKL